MNTDSVNHPSLQGLVQFIASQPKEAHVDRDDSAPRLFCTTGRRIAMTTQYPFTLRGLVTFILAQPSDAPLSDGSLEQSWATGPMGEYLESVIPVVGWVSSVPELMEPSVTSTIYGSFANVILCEELSLCDGFARLDDIFYIWDYALEHNGLLLLTTLYDLTVLGEVEVGSVTIRTYGDLQQLIRRMPHLQQFT